MDFDMEYKLNKINEHLHMITELLRKIEKNTRPVTVTWSPSPNKTTSFSGSYSVMQMLGGEELELPIDEDEI